MAGRKPRIPKPGTQVEYKGKKYVSLKELSKDINVPYSPLMHRYYRTGDIEDAVLGAANAEEKKKSYVLWNRQYEPYDEVFDIMQEVSELRKSIPLEDTAQGMQMNM